MDQEVDQEPDMIVEEETSSQQHDLQQQNEEQTIQNEAEEGDLNDAVHVEKQPESEQGAIINEENDQPNRTKSLVIDRVPSRTTTNEEEEEIVSQHHNKEDDDNNVIQPSSVSQPENNKRRKRRLRLSENHPLSKFVKDVLLPKFKQAASRMEDASETAWDRISQVNERFSAKLEEFDRFRPWETMRILLGLLLMFFGHKFRVTFAIIEALRHGGSDELLGNIQALQDQVHAIRIAHKHDKLVDEDNDGIPDYLQTSKRDLVKRRVRVAIKAIQVKVVQSAMQNIWTAFVSATATVKVESARRLSLGLSLGNDFRALLKRYVTPQLLSQLDDESSEYVTKWVPSVVDYLATFIGIIFAISLSAHLAIITTSSRGALLMVTGTESLLKAVHSKRQIRELEALGIYVVAFVASCFFQWFLASTAMHELNVVLQFILLPFHSLESGLFTLVHLVKSDAEKFQSVLGSSA